jgi:hypothetical protein
VLSGVFVLDSLLEGLAVEVVHALLDALPAVDDDFLVFSVSLVLTMNGFEFSKCARSLPHSNVLLKSVFAKFKGGGLTAAPD